MIIYDSNLKDILALSNSEIRVLFELSMYAKNNIVNIDIIPYIGKTFHNNVSKLVKKKIVYRTNESKVLYIEPMFLCKGSLKKCVDNSCVIRKK